MFEYSPAWPHGKLQAAFSEIYYVVGTNKTHHAGVDIQTSRTMTVVRNGGQLTLLNTVRLDDEGLRELDALGKVRHVVRLGAFHGRDDPFYCDRYGAALWAPPGAVQADGRAADHALTPGGALPVPGGEVFAFESAKFSEVAVLLGREGGILITCDAIQNWARVDAFFSPACGATFDAQGLIREANLPSTWRQACEPSAEDFRRLLGLRFRHLLSAHGEPLRDVAYERVRASVVEAFAEHDLEGTLPAASPLLRLMRASDIPIFYEQQRDPVAIELAAFPARERDAFETHWQKIRANTGNWVRTIERAGAICGYVTAFQREGVWEIGYWLGREHWGKGLATWAVAEFLAEFRERPLYAAVVVTNQPSVRVLEKCGFRRVESRIGDDGIEEVHLALER